MQINSDIMFVSKQTVENSLTTQQSKNNLPLHYHHSDLISTVLMKHCRSYYPWGWAGYGVKAQQGDRCQCESFPEGYSFLTNPPTVLVNSPGWSSWVGRLDSLLVTEAWVRPALLPHTDPDILLSGPLSILATTKSIYTAKGTRFN